MKTGPAGTSRSVKTVLFTMVLVFTASLHSRAQSSSDFAGLQEHINKQVTVETLDGQVTGQLLRVEESRLVVYESGSPRPIARESVRTIKRHKSRHTAAWVGGMTAAGLGAGFLLDLRSFDDAINANAKIGASAGLGAGAGAAAGYALSRMGKKDEVVFQSSETSEPAAIPGNAENERCASASF
jgi:hypothetical protein